MRTDSPFKVKPNREFVKKAPRQMVQALKRTAILALLAGALFLLHRHLPAQHNPFRPLDLTRPAGSATPLKLAMLKRKPELCVAKLEAAGVRVSVMDRPWNTTDCQPDGVVTLNRSLTPYSGTLRMTCPLTASLHMWERHSARPLAEAMLNAPLTRIETYGSFSCRRMYGRTSGSWSEHAYANAIDIWGFTLGDGRTIDVKSHWRADTPEGRYLKRVFRDGCKLFSVSLGPDYNAAHADHFHFDMGTGDTCR